MSDRDHQLVRFDYSPELVAQQLVKHVPGLSLEWAEDWSTRIRDLGPVQRTALWALVADVDPSLNPRTVREAETIGDVLALVGPRAIYERLPVGRERGTQRTRRVRLTPLLPSDVGAIEELYAASLDPTQGYRWRYNGRTPSPQEFEASLFSGVHCQYLAVDPATSRSIGLVVAYDYITAAGHLKVGFLRCSAGLSGLMIEAIALFIEYLFSSFPLKKVYAEVPEYNLDLVRGLPDDLLFEETRFREYCSRGSELHDLVIFAIPRAAVEYYADILMD